MSLGYFETMVSWLAADGVATEYTIASLGFEPKAVMVVCMGHQSGTSGHSDTADWNFSIGFAESGGTRRSVSSFSDDSPTTSDCGVMARDDAVLHCVNGSGSLMGALDIEFDTDEIRLVVDNTAPADLSVLVKIWGGDDIDAVVVGDIAEPGSTGDQDYSATGMASGANADQVLFLAGVQSTAALNSGAATDAGMYFGMAHDSGQFVTCINADDASGTSDTDQYGLSGECVALLVVAGGNPNARASFSQWNTDGFRLNWAARATSNRRSIFMAIKGGQWAVGELTIDASTASSTSTVSGLAFQPDGILLATCSGAEASAGTSSTLACVSIGGGTSTSDRRCLMLRENSGAANMAVFTGVRDDCAVGMQNNSTASRERWDIDAITSDGFRLITDQANINDVANWWIAYAAFASASAGGGTTYTLDMPDAMAVTDERVSGLLRNRHFEDASQVADEQFLSRVLGRHMSDVTPDLSDQQWLGRVRGRLADEGVAATDEQWLGRTLGRVMDDPLDASDRMELSRLVGRVMFDDMQPSDQLLVTRYFNRVFVDFLELFDEFEKTVSGAVPVFTVTLNDALIITDEILAYRERNREMADIITLADGTIVSRIRIQEWSDALQITDEQLQFLHRTILSSDPIEVTDTHHLFRIRVRDLLDAFEVVDDFAATVSGVLPELTAEVIVRLGVARDPTRLGMDAAPRLSAEASPDLGMDAGPEMGNDPGPILGGYN